MRITPLSLTLPGVKESDFAHYSHYHGAGHVNRVIVLGQVLAHMIHREPKERLLLSLWAATYTHDLARTHDGTCYMHGQWAAERRLPGLMETVFRPYHLEESLEAIQNAVAWHSYREEPPFTHPNYGLIALLKDADALDRCRLGPDEFDPSYLRYPQTAKMIEMAEGLYHHGHQTEDIEGMWAWALEHLNG